MKPRVQNGEIMTNLQQVIDESRPMLEEFLIELGLHREGTLLDFRQVLEPFSLWLDAQDVTEDDRFYLATRVGAFICEYLIKTCSGQRVIENGRILMRVPIQKDVLREFDPYSVAVGMAAHRSSLKEFLDVLCS